MPCVKQVSSSCLQEFKPQLPQTELWPVAPCHWTTLSFACRTALTRAGPSVSTAHGRSHQDADHICFMQTWEAPLLAAADRHPGGRRFAPLQRFTQKAMELSLVSPASHLSFTWDMSMVTLNHQGWSVTEGRDTQKDVERAPFCWFTSKCLRWLG